MPRTNSRKRNIYRNDNTARVSTASNLSPNAPEFIPNANNDNVSNSREYLEIQPVPFFENSNVPNNSGNNSKSNSIETAIPECSIPDGQNEGQRDVLTNLLNESKVDCVICYERAKNVEQIWNCRNCFQIMHLKCIMVWFIKSQSNGTWRCPACQSEVTGKPDYLCFCGTLKNPFSNNVDIPHSCGQICGLQKKNANVEYNNCHHKCTLLCHPGPCPQCVVQVLRRCRCEKTEVYVQCGQSTPILCQNICSKQLNCKNHVCEKRCHVGDCEPCKKNCPQNIELMETNRTRQEIRPRLMHNSRLNIPIEHMVSEEELRMLGLDPEELLRNLNRRSNFFDEFNYVDVDSDFDDDDDDDDDDDFEDVDNRVISYNNISENPTFILNRNHFARVFWPHATPADLQHITENDISNNLPVLIANYLQNLHSGADDDVNRMARHNYIDPESSSSSEESLPSVDSPSSMESDESRHQFVSYSESNNESIPSYSSTDLSRSSNFSSPSSLSDTEDSNSNSSISDASSSC